MPDDRTNPLVNVLQLAGIVRCEQGVLQARNRIYAEVFDRAWVRANLPEPEVRRQRAAYWRGVLRTAGVALVCCGVIALVAWQQKRIAGIQSLQASTTRDAVVRLTVANGVQWLNQGDWPTALLWFAEAFQLDSNPANEKTHRLRLAGLLRQTPHLDQMWFHQQRMSHAEFAAEGTLVLAGDATNGFRLWSVATGAAVSPAFGPANDDDKEATLSPDGRWAAVYTIEAPPHPLQLWDVATGKLVDRTFEWQGQPLAMGVSRVRFSPRGDAIAGVLGDDPTTVGLWETATGRHLQTFRLRERRPGDRSPGSILCVRFDRTGERLVTTSTNRNAIIWDVRHGEPVCELIGHSDWVYSASFSPDGRQVATASFDRTWRIWETATGTEIYRGRHEGDAVRTVEFSPDGKRALTGGWDLTVRLWDVQERRLIPPIIRDNNRVMDATFSPDGRRVLTVNWEGVVRVWDLVEAPVSRAYIPGAFSPDGRFVVSQVGDRLAVERCASQETVAVLGFRPESLLQCRFSEHGNRLLVLGTATNEAGTRTGEARLWTLARTPASSAPIGLSAGLTNLVASANLERFVVWATNEFSGWALGQKEPACRVSLEGGRIRRLALDSRAERIAVAWGREAQIFSFQGGAPLGARLVHSMSVHHVAFSPDDRWLVTTTADATLDAAAAQLWRLTAPGATPVRIHRLPHRDGVLFATFSPDSRRVATCSEDQTAIVWDVEHGNQLTPPLPHQDQVFCASFSTDGRWLVTVNRGGSAQVWDAATGEPVTLPIHPPASPWLPRRPSLLECAFDLERRAVCVMDSQQHRGWTRALAWDEGPPQKFLRTAQLLSAQRQATPADVRPPSGPDPTDLTRLGNEQERLIHAYAPGGVQAVDTETLRRLWRASRELR